MGIRVIIWFDCAQSSLKQVYVITDKYRFYMVSELMIHYTSVAVMTRAFPDYTGANSALVLLQNIASYMLLACGVIYVISVSQSRRII